MFLPLPWVALLALTQATSAPVEAGAPAPKALDVSAALGKGVTARSGDISITIRAWLQLQASTLVPGPDGEASRANTFTVRRARLLLKGDLPYELSWLFHLAFAASDFETGDPSPIRDFYVQWKRYRDLSLRAGQMKVPFDSHRWITSSTLQLVDRSVIDRELAFDRDIGVLLYSDDLFGWNQHLHYALGVWQGDGRNRVGTNVGLLYSARVRVSLFAPIDDRQEGDLGRAPELRAAIGVSGASNVATPRPRSSLGVPSKAATFDFLHAGADLVVKWRGLSLLAQLALRQADAPWRTNVVNGAPLTEYSRSAWGWFVQGGAFVTDWLELVARYGDLRPLGPTDPTLTRQRELGGGLNVFLVGHDLKLQADYFWLDDGAWHHGDHQVRVQAQLFF